MKHRAKDPMGAFCSHKTIHRICALIAYEFLRNPIAFFTDLILSLIDNKIIRRLGYHTYTFSVETCDMIS